MQPGAILLVLLMASAGPGPALAQTAGGAANTPAGPQAPAAQGLRHNTGAMAEMMHDIHQMLHLGPLTPKQAEQLSEMMTRLGVMMQEMSRPQSEKYQDQHQRQLEEMKTRLEEIKNQLKSQRRLTE